MSTSKFQVNTNFWSLNKFDRKTRNLGPRGIVPYLRQSHSVTAHRAIVPTYTPAGISCRKHYKRIQNSNEYCMKRFSVSYETHLYLNARRSRLSCQNLLGITTRSLLFSVTASI